MLRAVIDTSSLISYLLTRGDIMRRVVAAWLAGGFEVYFAPATLDELAKVLDRPSIARVAAMPPDELLSVVNSHGVFVPGAVSMAGVCRDPKDDILLACAVEAQAEYLISSDRDLLDMRRYDRLSIVNPGEFLLALDLHTLSVDAISHRFTELALEEILARVPLDPKATNKLRQALAWFPMRDQISFKDWN
jgi:putative PIN family toxin of toxin-antitoxin system